MLAFSVVVKIAFNDFIAVLGTQYRQQARSMVFKGTGRMFERLPGRVGKNVVYWKVLAKNKQ